MKTSFTSVIQPMKTHLVAECFTLHPSVLAQKSEKIVQKCKKTDISRLHDIIRHLFTNKKFKCPWTDEILSPQCPRC